MAPRKVWQSMSGLATIVLTALVILGFALYNARFDLFPLALALAVTLLLVQTTVEMDWRVSEQSYRELFEQAPKPMWVYNSETLQFLAVNGAALQQYGFAQEEFLKMRVADIRVGDSVAGVADDPEICGQTANGQPAAYESRHRK